MLIKNNDENSFENSEVTEIKNILELNRAFNIVIGLFYMN